MNLLQRLWKNQNGGVAIYVAFFSILALSAGSISVDLGRLITLKAQMQHRADAGASAAAAYLDGTEGAMTRAGDVARFSSNDTSNLSRQADLDIATVNFYSEYSPTPIIATSDSDASIVEVVLAPRLIDFFFTPFMGLLVDNLAVAESRAVNASAVAQAEPLMCRAPPLMTCDPTEDGGIDLMDSDHAGIQMVLKAGQGNGPMAPGNFGLLETGYGPGANNVEQALADVEPPGCTSDEVTTEPGNMANKVQRGLNARFNGSSFPYRAPNVRNYPRDTVYNTAGNSGSSGNNGNSGGGSSNDADTDTYLGDADWDADAYWLDAHEDSDLPSDLEDASRYQVYLYELGETYDRNGMKTVYPVDSDVPTNYSRIEPSHEDLPIDGEPDSDVASNGAERRVIEVAILRCIAQSVRGRGTYSTGGRYIKAFITEEAGSPPNSVIYGELIGRSTPSNSNNFHANARIIE